MKAKFQPQAGRKSRRIGETMFTEEERQAELKRRQARNIAMGNAQADNARPAERDLAQRDGMECIHCGNPFLPHLSVAGAHGLCEVCAG